MGEVNLKRLIESRLKLNYSQKYVSISVGVAPSIVSRWESGIKVPSRDKLAKLAKLYGVSMDYLVGITDDPQTKEKPANADGLKESTINRIKALPEPILLKLLDLMDVIQEYQGSDSEEPAAQESSAPPG